jgi:hypothetical protein
VEKMADWEIKKSLGQCYSDGKEFEVAQKYFAALVETDEGFQRRDYSVEYWQTEKPQVYCFWQTKMGDPKQKKNMFIDDDMLMAFFARLAEETDEEKVNFRFVLTLILMRKRKLKYNSDGIKDGKEIWYLKVAGENRTVTVVNPQLTEDQIEQLSTQMNQVLQLDME